LGVASGASRKISTALRLIVSLQLSDSLPGMPFFVMMQGQYEANKMHRLQQPKQSLSLQELHE